MPFYTLIMTDKAVNISYDGDGRQLFAALQNNTLIANEVEFAQGQPINEGRATHFNSAHIIRAFNRDDRSPGARG